MTGGPPPSRGVAETMAWNREYPAAGDAKLVMKEPESFNLSMPALRKL